MVSVSYSKREFDMFVCVGVVVIRLRVLSFV